LFAIAVVNAARVFGPNTPSAPLGPKSALYFVFKISWILDLDTSNLKVEESTSDTTEEVYSSHLENIEEGLDIIEHHIHNIFEITERVKSQRYKGKKIPGKYLTKNPSKMKKEIDTYRGKKEYKKDWDADYKSGKGGVGKRVKTKKSAATKAYQRMFGEGVVNEGLMTYLGIGTALLILRFIIRVFRGITKYNHIMKSIIQAANMFSHLRMTKYKKEGDDFKVIDKDMDALQVVEYSDKYWIKFIPENAPITSIRVFKMEDNKKVTKIVIELKDKMDEFPLPQRYYDELLEIIKRKL
jgi:hypothetical protein